MHSKCILELYTRTAGNTVKAQIKLHFVKLVAHRSGKIVHRFRVLKRQNCKERREGTQSTSEQNEERQVLFWINGEFVKRWVNKTTGATQKISRQH